MALIGYRPGDPPHPACADALCESNIAVHLPDADKVVIIEGTAHIIQDNEIDNETWDVLDNTFQKKYQVDTGPPYIYVNPKRVLAWNGEGLTTIPKQNPALEVLSTPPVRK
ncbi:MAG TPA: hypothetical protein GX400_11745 [Chloroflexi bacterium]|nr:hypothetical protein [Chloroflexota bacterium]